MIIAGIFGEAAFPDDVLVPFILKFNVKPKKFKSVRPTGGLLTTTLYVLGGIHLVTWC